MPHLVLFETEAGTNAIMREFGTRDRYNTWLRDTIYDSFRSLCKEVLDKETQIPIHLPTTTSSMPVDILVVVVFWRRENRLRKEQSIQSHMQLALFNCFQYHDSSVTVNATANMIEKMPAKLVLSLFKDSQM